MAKPRGTRGHVSPQPPPEKASRLLIYAPQTWSRARPPTQDPSPMLSSPRHVLLCHPLLRHVQIEPHVRQLKRVRQHVERPVEQQPIPKGSEVKTNGDIRLWDGAHLREGECCDCRLAVGCAAEDRVEDGGVDGDCRREVDDVVGQLALAWGCHWSRRRVVGGLLGVTWRTWRLMCR